MKTIHIKNEGITSTTKFTNNNRSLEPVMCAFDANQPCSPNCAACSITHGPVYKGSTPTEHAFCERGSFVIGNIG